MTDPGDKIIVALDVASVEEAKQLIAKLKGSVGVYKIGLELLFAGGFQLARELAEAGEKVFIDAKLLDIETTVERATSVIAASGVTFLTVHAQDAKTLDAAVRGRSKSKLKLLGVTVLTNLARDDLKEQGVDREPQELAIYRAMLAQEAGCDGVVASGQEAEALRKALGEDMLIVTPGIRPEGASTDDQARAVSPSDAIKAGANYIVVGRPIIRAPDPRKAAEAIASEIASAS